MKAGYQSRRAFLQAITASGAASLLAQGGPEWKERIGLELYTVRDLLARDFEGTIARVAEIGYREVEPVGYGGLAPEAFRALLDRYKLRAVSTHAGATDGPGLEKELAGHQVIGLRYTGISAPRNATRPASRPARTEETVKRSAGQYNKYGAIARKFGMKVLIHNHAGEFDVLENSRKTQYDILLAETDPALVAMQLDIGWARLAGQDVVEMFRRNPGRYELWHVKDVESLRQADTNTPPGKRRGTFVPIGQGEIDYRVYFAEAKLAGLAAFVIEQDNAGENGRDAMAAARANYQGLLGVLSAR